MADLARVGLVEVNGEAAVPTGDQLDADYLRGFLRSAANTRRATSGSGTFRIRVIPTPIPKIRVIRE